MDETKKQPELFKADLFSSPSQPTPTGGLSFGLAGDSFNSSFSLAPALTTSSPAPKKKEEKAAVTTSSPVKQTLDASSIPQSAVKTTPIYSVATPTSFVAELSNVPLDSPPPSSESPAVSSGGTTLSSGSTPHRPPASTTLSGSSTPHRPPAPGWNDPPPQPLAAPGFASVGVADIYSLQPLAGQPDTPKATPTAPPPVASVTPVQQVAANPYRLGQTGGKRVARGLAGVSVHATPPSQPLPQAPPPSLPPSLPTAVTPGPAQAYSTPVEVSAVPPHVGVAAGFVGGVAQPLCYHWFYLRPSERYWIPFSLTDSAALEQAWTTADPSHQVLNPTDGGRYDVDLHAQSRTAVYWSEPPSQVRRCSWFYKGDTDRWYMPYTEDVAASLEEHYMSAVGSGVWGGRVEVGGGEGVVMHSQSSMAHYPASQFQPITHEVDYVPPRSVLRGFAEIAHVEQGEQSRIDHLVFVVHGIGEHCDLSFRCLVDCVDDFREVSQLMLRTHRFTGQAPLEGDTGGRVEFLPVHWHAALHGDSEGVDKQLRSVSLKSIKRLRDFTNSTLLDILFFTSPVYLQTIVDRVAGEMNRMYELFLRRNPGFSGGVSLMGHSLGSCILFDILAHQTGVVEGGQAEEAPILEDSSCREVAREMTPEREGEGGEEDTPTTLEAVLSQLGLPELMEVFQREQIDFESLLMISNEDLKELGIPMGPRKKLSSFISQRGAQIRAAKEHRVRAEVERRAKEKELQQATQRQATVQGVKYVKGALGMGQPLVSIPQLRFKVENLFALGSPIGLFLIVRGVEELGPEYKLPHCQQIFNIFHPFDPVAYRLEPLVCSSPPAKPVLMPHHKGRKRFHLELYETVEQVGASMKQYVVEGMRNMWQQLNELARSHRTEQLVVREEEPDTPTIPVPVIETEAEVGQLNRGRRVDYVLQEKPIEKLNEYLFALSSHLSYWRSEDTALFILKEVYEEMNPELIKS